MRISKRPVSIGISSLFAVLIVLCLIVFAVLSSVTAKAELSLAQKAADSVKAFYDAEYRATLRLNEAEQFGEAGEFTEEIDENRDLFIKFDIVNEHLVILEWVVVRKDSSGNEQSAVTEWEPVVLPWE
jgi:hypothetical protein